LSCGFAGGLNPALTAGAVVFDAGNAPRLEAELARTGARRARFHCADRVAASVAEKQSLWQSAGADAVEMESQGLAAVCVGSQIPFAVVRVILDTAGEDLPLDFNRLMTPDLRMSYSRLAMALLAAPGKIGALLELQRRSKTAAETLSRTLAAVIGA
jgi:adenosylhomocysteine nucleosidase